MLSFILQNPIAFFIAFIPGLINLALLFYILFGLSKNKLTNLFALLIFFLAVWQFNDAIGRLNITEQTNDFWDCILAPSWILIGALCFHFALYYSEILKSHHSRIWLILIYAPGIVFLALFRSHFYPHILEHVPFWGWMNYHNHNNIDKVQIYWISILVIAATVVLFYRTYKVRKDLFLRNQSLWITAGIAIPSFTGIITQVIFPMILLIPAIPVTSTLMTSFSIATVIALRKYKLFSLTDLVNNEMLIENLPVMVLSISEQKRITYLNEFAGKILGLEKKNIYELKFPEIFYFAKSEDIEMFQLAWNDALKQKAVDNVESTIITQKGETDIIFSMKPVLNRRKVRGILLTARDITDLKKSTQLIKNKELLLAEAQQLSHIGSWEWNVTSNIVSWSDELFRIYGYQPDEIKVTYETFLQNVHPDDRENVNNIIQKSLEDHHEFSVYHRIIKKDKEEIITLSQGKVATDENNKVIKMTGTAQDVTELKNKEEILKIQNEELQKINSELDKFVYSVSHDLRAPLTSMLGLVAISEEQKPDPGMMERLALLKINIKKLDKFILDILSYSKNSRTEIESEEIDFKSMLNEIILHIGFMSNNENKVDIKIDIKNELPFYSDKNRLNIIFTNLISNAIRYSNPAITSPYVKISVEVSPTEVIIKICDNGIGIDRDQQEKIFEMFYRAAETSTGSGLGLYIASESVKKLNGQINVVSEPGKGAIFNIRIPNS